ncbi:MAG: prepilin peptidase [Alicyclobacillus macrosporangiidus]|uniref:prepilin peptidase n=1 Tax=Alicyclobacillus macrosporangiidus TaxID=392015 RepID=UPI0026EF0BAE|nr:A24 family peptidase [Alicyclobacillus macrosporangiidus]MCL6598563.1 prepilin peptidase [Alicyclobacillus macrosporangiidus]
MEGVEGVSAGGWTGPLFAWMGFVFGLLFGSFINVVGYRVPRGESVVFPRSHCPDCGRTLSAWELIPAVSWLVLGGRCRTCRHPIPLRYPCIELAAGALFASTAVHADRLPIGLAWSVFWLLLLATVATDLTSMRVPNVLTLPGAVVVLGLAIASGVRSAGGALLGMAGCTLTLWGIHLLSRGRMGLGDVKLYASIGAMLGFWGGLESLVLASAYGTVIGYGMRAVGWLKPRQPVPFVPFIAMGVVTAVWFGDALTRWYLRVVLGWAG